MDFVPFDQRGYPVVSTGRRNLVAQQCRGTGGTNLQLPAYCGLPIKTLSSCRRIYEAMCETAAGLLLCGGPGAREQLKLCEMDDGWIRAQTIG
jgi:hypothetical protein